MQKKNKKVLWQKKFLVVSGIIESLIVLVLTLFIVFFGYQGFKSGEMGNMIGIFSIALFIFLAPYFIVRIIILRGLKKEKKWAAGLNAALSLIVLGGALLLFEECPVGSIFIVLYAAFSVWAGIVCYRYYDDSKTSQG